MKMKMVLMAVFLMMMSGCEQASWFAGGAVADAALQAEQKKDVYAELLSDPCMMAVLIQAAGAGITTREQQQMILAAIEQYDNIHGTAAIIKKNAEDPAWWIAFVLGLTAAYQKYQRSKEAAGTAK